MKLLNCFIIFALFLCNFLHSSLSHAASKPEYDSCILNHLKGAKTDVAAQLITKACDVVYGDSGFIISSDERKYHSCLLDNLVNVESYIAVDQITRACDRESKN